MSDEDNYIFLSYNGQQEEVKIPSSFEELKDSFYTAFNADTNKNYKFSYCSDDEEPIINEDNFSEEIKNIQEGKLIILVVEDETESKKDDLNKCIIFSSQSNNPQKVELKRQNAIKGSFVLNNDQKNVESSVNSSINFNEGKKSNNNFVSEISGYANDYNEQKEKNENNNDNNKKPYEYIQIKSQEIIKESISEIDVTNELKEKEKQIEELNETIKKLKESESQKINEYNELSKALKEEENKNINNIKKLENNLKTIQDKLEKEKKEKIKIIEDKKEIESQYKLLKESKETNNRNEIEGLKAENNELRSKFESNEKDLKIYKDKYEKEKDKYKKLKIEQNNNNNQLNKIKQENSELVEKIKEININKNKEIEKHKSQIKTLEQNLKNLKDIEDKKNDTINIIINNSDNEDNNDNGKNSHMNLSNLSNTDKDMSEMSKLNKKKQNQKKKNKLEFINKKMKQSENLNLSQFSNLNKDQIIKQEKEYNEKIIKNNLQNSRMRLSLNIEIIGKNLDNKNNEKNEIKQNIIKNEEIMEFKKKLKEKEDEIKKNIKIIENLNIEIKNLEEENKLKDERENFHEKYEKENEEYKIKLKEFENQLNDKEKIIKENNNKIAQIDKEKNEYYSKFQLSENKLKNMNNLLNENNNKINSLQQENQNQEMTIRNFQSQIEEYKSLLSQSQKIQLEKNNEKNKEIEIKLKEYRAQLENKYIQKYQEEIKISIEHIKKSILNKNTDLQNEYEKKYNDLKNNYNQKFSQISTLMLQNQKQNNINKCNTVHNGIKCNKCFKSPIVGYRYKCSICSTYNLCDECEEKNSQTEDHPHAFIKLRKEEVINYNNQNPNLNNNKFNIPRQNNKADNEFKMIHFGEKYSFELINKHNLKGQIEEGEDEINIEIIIKNNGASQWPFKGAKLVPNEKKNIKGEEVILDPLKPGEQKQYNIKFDELKRYPFGNYTAGYIFEINGKTIGDNIDFSLVINERKVEHNDNNNEMDQKVIDDFRNEYSLGRDEYPDDKLWDALKKSNMDKGAAFSSLFDE